MVLVQRQAAQRGKPLIRMPSRLCVILQHVPSDEIILGDAQVMLLFLGFVHCPDRFRCIRYPLLLVTSGGSACRQRRREPQYESTILVQVQSCLEAHLL